MPNSYKHDIIASSSYSDCPKTHEYFDRIKACVNEPITNIPIPLKDIFLEDTTSFAIFLQ